MVEFQQSLQGTRTWFMPRMHLRKDEDRHENIQLHIKRRVFSSTYYFHCSYDSMYRFHHGNDCVAWFTEELKNLTHSVESILSANVPTRDD